MDDKLALRLGRCVACAATFPICRPCFRGQSYCGASCRDRARAGQKRAARARHQASREGRADHRDRNRRRRLSKRAAVCVTDQRSENLVIPPSVSPPSDPPTPMVGLREVDGRIRNVVLVSHLFVECARDLVDTCIVCHRLGVLVSAWARRSRAPRSRAGPR